MAVYKITLDSYGEECPGYYEHDNKMDYRDVKNIVQVLVDKTKKARGHLDFNYLEGLLAKSGFTPLNLIEVEVTIQ